VKWVLGSSDTSISYSYACNYTVFVQALFLNSMSCRLAPRAVTEGVYGRLDALSQACYSAGAAILCLSAIVHYYWFPAAKPLVAATECHGEIPDIEVRKLCFGPNSRFCLGPNVRRGPLSASCMLLIQLCFGRCHDI